MVKWRSSLMMVFATLTLVGFSAHAQLAADDAMSPEEINADEPAVRPTLPAPDVLSCPARIQIFIDKSQSKAPSLSPLMNTKPDTDLSQTMQVYVDCNTSPLYNWPVSTGRERQEVAVSGKHYFSSTPEGNFHIDWRTTMYHSHLWNAPMPFANFFMPGIAIHATEREAYKNLGRRASGGCVRLHETNAETLYALITQYGAQNVLITITNGQADAVD